MNAAKFCSILKRNKINLFTGVPGSILKNIIEYASQDKRIEYIPATREDAAIGIASGAALCGKRALVLMQNSGLGNSINALASLNLLYRLPLLLLISWRGYEAKDAPEHLIMGKTTLKLLKDFNISYQVLTQDNIEKAIGEAIRVMDGKNRPVALVLKKGIIE